MFSALCRDYGALLHRFFLLIWTICSRFMMSFRRIDSFKWIRDRFRNRANSHNSTSSNNNNNNNSNNNNNNNNYNGNTTTRPPEGEEHGAAATATATTATIIATAQLSNNNSNNNKRTNDSTEDHLAEVLVVVNDTKIDATSQPSSLPAPRARQPAASADANANANVDVDANANTNGNEATLGRCGNGATAPIAREEEAEVGDDDVEAAAAAMEAETETVMGMAEEKELDCGCCELNGVGQCCPIDAKSTANKSTALPPNEALEQAAGVGAGAGAVQRSKSRVRTYLRKCKQRLTGQHQHAPPPPPPPPPSAAQAKPTIAITITTTTTTMATLAPPETATIGAVEKSTEVTAAVQRECGVALRALEEQLDEDEDAGEPTRAAACEDIDFGLSSPGMVGSDVGADTGRSVTAVGVAGDSIDETETTSQQLAVQQLLTYAPAGREQRLAHAVQVESGTAALIDRYLSAIYPVYVQSTRAILIRQARDLLVCSYYGCLQSFEQRFLCKFAEIAADLKQRHAIGENTIWCEGWPLATPTGELVLHLGALDSALLRPAEIYLCVCAADHNEHPKLHAVWRTTQQNAAALQRRCIDYNDPRAPYMSALTLEMLSDELPQLLQSLLVGVEHSIERVSLNELQMPSHGNANQTPPLQQHQQQQSSASTTLADASNNMNNSSNNNCNNNNNNNSNQFSLLRHSGITNSPKCALRRSELITKNKILNSKFMLRRLTNRQDSMNSTSSGNSCGSSGSASSDELLQCNNNNNNHHHNNHNNTSNSGNNGNGVLKSPTGATNSASTSPALPMFCLGNSFPHIDSDEENADEKRNSMGDDQFESEIVPPSSINEIPEKLLTASGIHLPGTCDLKGRPIVTVDAECVVVSGLNCYEIATVLLFYSTIAERKSNLNANLGLSLHANDQTTQQQHSGNSPSTATPTCAPPAAVAVNTSNAIKPPAHTYSTHNAAATTTTSPTTTVTTTTSTFTILIAIEKSSHMCVIDLICQSLKLLTRQIAYCEILAVCLERSLLLQSPLQSQLPLQLCNHKSRGENSESCSKEQPQLQPQLQPEPQQRSLKFISVDEVTTSVAPSQIPCGKLQGLHHHDARKWREFFALLEPFHGQCAAAGQRLVAAMSDIRSADLQGLPTRRQLYAQHRALSRALMDSELHNLRKRGGAQLARLQELAKCFNQPPPPPPSLPLPSSPSNVSHNTNSNNNNNNHNNNNNSHSHNNNNSNNRNSGNKLLLSATAAISNNNNTTNYSFATQHRSGSGSKYSAAMTSCNGVASSGVLTAAPFEYCNNIDVAIRLHKVTLLFNEVDRAAKRLEQLTEQRRERLRELTRQRALEDEIIEVTSWITSDGNETLQRFVGLQLDCGTAIKEQEQEFEKYYFISMKHLAKGRDLHDAAASIEALRDSAVNLKSALDCFAEKLELARERIEGASRLHQLLGLHVREEHLQLEMQRLAELIGVPGLVEKCRQKQQQQQLNECEQQQQQEQPHDETSGGECGSGAPRIKPNSLNLNCSQSSTKQQHKQQQQQSQHQQHHATLVTSTPAQRSLRLSHRSSSGIGSFDGQACHCWRESRNLEDMDALLDAGLEEEEEEMEDGEEEQSKIADSGVGGCERCEGNPKLTRICSCQSLNEAANLYDKSHNGDELDFECFERPAKRFMDIHSPIEANAHLQYHASSLELSKLEELSCLDPKIQKTLLLIMREMIGTERDYVHSLYYVIENYVDELLRDDIPQPLRGQRNVIFGNIEKIFEFHKWHFLNELERYERNPLKVGSAFLEMESKFYLYALYNKNKPKSDTLMSEYGTAFFKSKQFELNDKMDLASYLLKPVQRMGKYALLLQQLVKACSTVEGAALQEIGADVEELQRAEEMVKFQLRHGNDLLAMDSLRDCDVNVKEQGRLLRQNEFLVWQGRGGKKSLRQIFLFEELVLFSKARRFPDQKNLDIYIYKNSIKTSDIGLTAHVGGSPTKFEIWFRKRKPEDTWTMQCMSEDIKNAWTEEISKLLWKQANRNREIRLAEMSSMGIGSKPCLDIRPSNNQINDRSITISQLGKAPKLRHSFAGMHLEPGKNTRRPNSLISESSISSGTSSSSLSTGSSSGHERMGGSSYGGKSTASNHHALELINETQTLMLQSSGTGGNGSHNSSSHTNTLSSGTSSGCGSGSGSGISGGGGTGTNARNHKRSTTLVSQLSMESGILSDISMTPDQEQPDASTSWVTTATATAPTSVSSVDHSASAAVGNTTAVVMRRHRMHSKQHDNHNHNHKECHPNSAHESNGSSSCTSNSSNPYLKEFKDESINL